MSLKSNKKRKFYILNCTTKKIMIKNFSKKIKNLSLSLLTAGSLFLGLNSCNNNSVPVEDTIVCADVSSQDYSSLNYDFDELFYYKNWVDKDNFSFFHHTLVVLKDDKVLVSKTFSNNSTIKYYVSSI